MSGIPPIAIAVAAIVLALVLVAILYARNYVKVPPNQVAVFTGRGTPKIVRGGARFRVPVIERVDFMSLEPFNIQVSVGNAISSNGVGIAVDVVALIRFGSTDEAIATATQRFLTADRTELKAQLTEIIAGNMRAICAKMTVESLNSNRDELTRGVAEEAGSALGNIGMELDVLTIQDVRDRNGYIEALGRKRIAEVQRDAEIGEAEAKRDARIRAAQADQEAQTAESRAKAEIAQANRELSLRRAEIDTEVNAANARAAQAGPLAEAEARRAVVLAGVDTEQQETQRRIAVEEQRALRAERAQHADVVVPAEARRQAAVLDAQGQRDAAIAGAEADARQRELEGQADAEARKLAAAALLAELTAKADGERARLLAEADGQAKLAEALSAFTEQAARLRVLPDLIAALPEIAKQVAAPMGNIDHLVVLNGGGDGNDALSRVAGSVPSLLLQVLETAKAGGLDLAALLSGATGTDNKAVTAAQPAEAAAE